MRELAVTYLTTRYDPWVVAASVLIAIFASYVAMDLAKRAKDRRAARGWWVAGSVAMGTAIWVMHFVGMFAVLSPVASGHARLLTFLSWVAGIAGSGVALPVAWRGTLTPRRLAQAALAMGAGICAMHYIGMAALEMAPAIEWDWAWVAASAGIAMGASAAALISLFWMRGANGRHSLIYQAAAAVVMGLGISGVHYACMAAARFREGAVCLSANALGAESLGSLVLLASATMLTTMLVTSILDARAQDKSTRLTDSLRRALVDSLTGLPNRLLFEDRLARAIARTERAEAGTAGNQQRKLAVLSIALDGLRRINDSCGHAAGDRVLKEAASRLRGTARRGSTVARIGADSFLLLMEEVPSAADCLTLARRLIAVLERPSDVLGRPLELSGSVGIAIYPGHGQRDELVANADAAMHAARRTGAGTCALFDSNMGGAALEQLNLLIDLRRAIELDQMTLHYQPKIDGRRGQIRGVEALLRWHHPQRGMISPAVFIPLAERHGLINDLGNWVIDEACRQMQAWADVGIRMRVAINVSVHQLQGDDLVARIVQALDRHQVEASQLLCEITESAAMADVQATHRAFEGLERVSVYLSIDDFGTGYSSLSYLRQLPARQLKIDRGFVNDLEHSNDARAIVDAVIRLAHALGLRVVAEGVETPEQRDILLELECDELQGFLFAKPMPADALLAWVVGKKPKGTVDFSPSVVNEASAA